MGLTCPTAGKTHPELLVAVNEQPPGGEDALTELPGGARTPEDSGGGLAEKLPKKIATEKLPKKLAGEWQKLPNEWGKGGTPAQGFRPPRAPVANASQGVARRSCIQDEDSTRFSKSVSSTKKT